MREAARLALALLLAAPGSPARLVALRTVRLVVRHRCAKLPDVYVDDDVVAIDAKQDIVYQVSLTTTEPRHARDKALMDAMLASWRRLEPGAPQVQRGTNSRLSSPSCTRSRR